MTQDITLLGSPREQFFFDLYRTLENAAKLGGNYSFSNLRIALRPHHRQASITLPPRTKHKRTGWVIEKHYYNHRDQQYKAAIHIAHAKKPRGIIFYSLGWKIKPHEQIETINYFQSQGFTVIILPLAQPKGPQIGTLEESITRLQHFLFSGHSPLSKTMGKHLPVFIMAHSASANAMLHAIKRVTKSDTLHHRIKGIFQIAPFFDSANSSALAYPRLEKIYKRHARRYHDDLAGVPTEDRFYYYFKGIAHELMKNPKRRPTHGQVLELKFYGQDILEDSWQIHAELPRQIFVLSKNDPFSCYQSGMKVALKMNNTQILSCEEGHGPQDSAIIRKKMMDLIEECLNFPLKNQSSP